MNAKSKVKVLHNESAIEMNKIFAKMIENPQSDEYALLQKIRQDYPVYKVRVRQIKKNPNQEFFKGLTYEYMRNYIITHPKEIKIVEENGKEKEINVLLEKFDELILISQCQAKSRRYPVIKKWFLAQHPEIAQFGMEANAVAEEEKQDKNDKVVSFPQNNEPQEADENQENEEMPLASGEN
ncbi:MAG: hypothetical protein IJO69_05185 [Ruminiclostridium sp.]|nr:hypothetical protein [Ruminiclostridium sp.]MBQ9933210.1 hypothetical protein [Ruminiclostridium sp.]